MLCHSRHVWHILVLPLLAVFLGHVRSEEYITEDDAHFSFVTRPDIRAPRWNLTIFNEDQITPGYWFLAPYEVFLQPEDVGDPGWIGPHIYDGRGGLIWSGASMFDNRNVEDFRLSNVKGETLMTLIYQHTGAGIIMNASGEVLEEMQIDDASNVNTHEFHFVENGRRALVIKNDWREASLDESRGIGFDGQCVANFEHFLELDTETWETVFDWDSMDHVHLNESTLTEGSVEDRCSGWDFFHSNSVDKTPDGDYLFSSRHTDTIYKISGEDGHIIWRLGGKFSDFGEGDWAFSRQHHIRFRDQNATHMIVSLLDNAKGIDTQEPTYENSRGLLLALNEETMTVSVLTQIDHPDGEGHYAPRRGNYQELPDGNVLMGWSEDGLQSEHASDGTILMRAALMADWLGSYRNYKFNFTGLPSESPVVSSTAYTIDTGSAVTVAHVSWNGATEVATWNMYKTTEDDDTRVLIGWAERTGFESVVRYDGLASFVVLEAVDKGGKTLGMSDITETTRSANLTSEAVSAENGWTETFSKNSSGETILAYFLGLISGLVAVLLFILWRRCTFTRMNVPRWFPGLGRYRQLAKDNQEEEHVLWPRTSQGRKDPATVDIDSMHSRSRNSLDFSSANKKFSSIELMAPVVGKCPPENMDNAYVPSVYAESHQPPLQE